MKKLKVILIGAGNRGITYTNEMKLREDKFEVVAVAEPIESRRNYIKEKHNIPDNMCFEDWRPLLKIGKIADVAIIATMDRQHFEPCMEAISLHYDLLLEKPIAPTYEECKAIMDAAVKNNVKVVVCTVLRYTPLFIKIKEIIESGKIGEIIAVNHEECVGNIHQSHSFVRGNWGNSERSSCMLLQKSCHDLDLLQWLLNKRCKSVQSFGALSYFTRKNAPENTPEYCVEGCRLKNECQYNAIKLYYDDKANGWFRTTCTHLVGPTDEQVLDAITNTQYGKCVYKCDNDVVDHQVVNMNFEDEVTVSFTMNAFNKGGRNIHIMGTKGEIKATLSNADNTGIYIYDFKTKTEEKVRLAGSDGVNGGHGGGDGGIVETLYHYMNGNYFGKSVPTIEESFYNHMLVFAAEKSRIENRVVEISEFI